MKLLKKFFLLIMAISIVITVFPNTTVNAAFKLPFETYSKAVYLVNTDTNMVVYEQNANEKIYPASLTKIMSAIIVAESGVDLENTIVKVPGYIYDEFYGLSVSHAGILRGEEVRLIDLLYAMILPSGCEASSALADYFGDGNISEFVDMMNARAKEIGANDSNFTNAHGLFHEDQVTTAYDMYLITKHAMSIPILEKVLTSVTHEMAATNLHDSPRTISHSNGMLSKSRGGKYYYEFAKGIKTGSLPEVGKNLVTVASKNGYNYMLVTLAAPATDENGVSSSGHYIDAIKLYGWAFDSFQLQTILKTDVIMGETKVRLCATQDYLTLFAEKELVELLPNDVDITSIQKIKNVVPEVIAPISKGDILGTMDLKLNDEILATVNLVSTINIQRSELLFVLDATLSFLQTTSVKLLLTLLILLIVLFIFIKSHYRNMRRAQSARGRVRA